ncbi:hypothetical protein ABZY09_33455 [Streptomyces sp. NPDC002928]|uniref:hypothetical protein n=1 Tax=Streptomyces sp. NPDC002928 TaxID=3154440 RepID=UPI0033AA15FE
MYVRRLDNESPDLFLTHSPQALLAGCIGISESSGTPMRLTFERSERAHVLIVGRSQRAALGIFTAMLLDLAKQIITTPDRREIYSSPPFSIMDFLGTRESQIFTDTVMSLPLSVKSESATDTEMTTLTDFEYEITHRDVESVFPGPAKLLFMYGLQAAHGVRSRGFYAQPGLNPRASKFMQLLREGAPRSLHVIVWCNSFANMDLTVVDGIDSFDHLIVLDKADELPNNLVCAGVDTREVGRSWYINRRDGAAEPFVPFAMPTEAWCNDVVRTFRLT